MAGKKGASKASMPSMASLTKLELFLGDAKRPQETLSLAQLQGFLYAVSCSPYEIDPEDWLPVVFNEQDAGFANNGEANSVLDAIVAIYNYLDQQVEDHKVVLPESCQPEDVPENNFSEKRPFNEWCAGFLIGHGWLDECWEGIPDDLDEEIGSCMMVLSFFADRDLAEEYHRDYAEPNETFEQMASAILAEFDDALVRYADIGALLRGDGEEV